MGSAGWPLANAPVAAVRRKLQLTDKYVKAIEDDIKDVILPEKTPEEEEENWNRLCERIKNEYGDDLISE